MGLIRIQLAGSFRPNDFKDFTAMQHGHAAAVLEAIYWLQHERLPKAVEQDRQLRDAGHFPEKGFNVRLDVPRDIACPNCGQVNQGQAGEYPCPICGLPTAWDAPEGAAPQSDYKSIVEKQMLDDMEREDRDIARGR